MARLLTDSDIIYQVYPRSFCDGNGDGVGDLPGILSKVDYLASLGITVIWLNPVYRSPMFDNGYDISDYCAIDPLFGTLDDFDRLLAALHQRGIKLVMDFVPNHCSDQHPWFQEALHNPDSPYRDWFFFRPGKGDGPPNNWQSFFGGPAWTKVGDEYYLHLFARQQPDLNWDNPAVRREFHKILRFWLDRGIDGFRLDAVTFLSKHEGLPDLKPGQSVVAIDGPYVNGPHLKQYLREFHSEAFDHYDTIVLAEAPGVYRQNALEYLGGDQPLFDILFTSDWIDLDRSPQDKFLQVKPPLPVLAKTLSLWQNFLHGQGHNLFFWTNHDQPRTVSRFGTTGALREASAKALAFVLFTLDGIPLLYQGEELGLANARFESIEDYRDIDSLNYWQAERARGVPAAPILARLGAMSRDHARTPLPWTGQPGGGFSTGTPWIGFSEPPAGRNVQAQEGDPDSLLHWVRRLTELRRTNEILRTGEFVLLEPEHPSVLLYQRQSAAGTLLMMVNFTDREQPVHVPQGVRLLLGSEKNLKITLAGWESRLYTS